MLLNDQLKVHVFAFLHSSRHNFLILSLIWLYKASFYAGKILVFFEGVKINYSVNDTIFFFFLLINIQKLDSLSIFLCETAHKLISTNCHHKLPR